MNTSLTLFTAYQITLALFAGLLSIFITLRFTNRFVLKIKALEVIQSGNTAVALFQGVIIFCVLSLVETSILPSVDALRTMVLAHETVHPKMFLISLQYFALFYVISLVFSYLLILIGFYVFIYGTAKLDEMQEIKNNNLSVSVLLSIVLLSMTLFIRPAFGNLMQSFVDFNALEKPMTDVKKEDPKNVQPEQVKPID
jgi:uncharacterized membrane protein YjfL (UPF0719 family)